MSQTYLQVVSKFTKGDDSNLTGVHIDYTPVNNILHSLFTEIDVALNGKIISPGTDTYPYKAYLEKLLSYRSKTLETQKKSCSLWEKDTAGHMDDVKLDAATQSRSQFDIPGGDNAKITVTAANLELSYPDGFEKTP